MIENLEKQNLNCNVFSVYDYNALTIQELLSQFFTKINECVDVSNDTNKLAKWLVDEGLSIEVVKQLMKWLSDGTLEGVINENIFGDLNNKVNVSKENRERIEVYLDDYKDYLVNDDWTTVFNHIFNNVIKDNVGIVKFSGERTVKSTINVPYGVDIQGSSLPYSKLIPSSDFLGEYVITQLSKQSHINISNVYIDFHNNQTVKGIFILNPYDYSSLQNIVGNECNRTFLQIGGSEISQTLKVENCCVYSKNTINEPIAIFDNLQEGYFCNNKFLSSGMCNVDLVVCDGLTTSTFINNSFANTNKRGLVIKSVVHKKRIVGNLIIGNLFENCNGEHVLSLSSYDNSDFEGYNNAINNNDIMNSTRKLFLDNVTNTTVIDNIKCEYGTNARRTFNINIYDLDKASEPFGNCELYADGDTLQGSFGGYFKSKNLKMLPASGNRNPVEIYYNANDDNDYGVYIQQGSKRLLHIYNNEIINNNGGYQLLGDDGKMYRLKVNSNGQLVTEKIV